MKFKYTYIRYSEEWDEYSVHIKDDAKLTQKAMEAEQESRK